MSPFAHALREFATPVLATAAAMCVVVALVAIVRRLTGNVLVDPVHVLTSLLSRRHPPAAEQALPVNVEFRDASGALMDIGPLIRGTLRNGRGHHVELSAGTFHGCDPKVIKAGGTVVVSLQDGRLRERLVVQLDYRSECLFVQSVHELAEVIAKINGSPTSVSAFRSGQATT